MTVFDVRGTLVGEVAVALKAPCLVATTGSNIALTGVQAIDGVTVGNAGERVLVKDQTTPNQNGIYIAAAGTWVQVADWQSSANVVFGTLVLVTSGAVNGGLLFEQTCTDNPIVIGTSAIGFAALPNATAQAATSTSSVAIGTGAKTFATQTGKAFLAGLWVLAFETSNPANAMLAQVTSYSGGTLVLNATATGGSGTLADWTIVLTNSPAAAGRQPPVGSGNVTGPGSATSGHVATFGDTTGKLIGDGGALGALASLSTLTAQYLAPSAAAFGINMLNGTIVASASGSALTFAVKTLAGNDPSAGDPVWFFFRSATPASGAASAVEVTAALSVTVPSLSTMGFANATPGRLWCVAVNSAGTVSLALINCLSGTSIFPLAGWGIASITAFGAGANNAQVFYGAGSLSAVPYSVLGYGSYETGTTMATAGTWTAAPTRTDTYRPGLPMPGHEVQVAYTPTGAAATLSTDSMPWGSNAVPTSSQGTQIMSQAITPSSSSNLLEVEAQAFMSIASAARIGVALFQDSLPNALTYQYASFGFGWLRLKYRMQAGTLSSTTMKVQGGSVSATSYFNSDTTTATGGGMNSFIQVREIMA